MLHQVLLILRSNSNNKENLCELAQHLKFWLVLNKKMNRKLIMKILRINIS